MNLPLVYRLPVYFKSVTKNAITFKKKRNETTKKKEKSFPRREFNPRPLTCKGNALSIAPRQVTLSKNFKFVIFNIFCPWNSAGGRCLEPVELYLWKIERYIRGKQAWFWQLKPYYNSFRRIWRTYGWQVSRKTVAKSLADGVVQFAIGG